MKLHGLGFLEKLIVQKFLKIQSENEISKGCNENNIFFFKKYEKVLTVKSCEM